MVSKQLGVQPTWCTNNLVSNELVSKQPDATPEIKKCKIFRRTYLNIETNRRPAQSFISNCYRESSEWRGSRTLPRPCGLPCCDRTCCSSSRSREFCSPCFHSFPAWSVQPPSLGPLVQPSGVLNNTHQLLDERLTLLFLTWGERGGPTLFRDSATFLSRRLLFS